MKYLLEQGAAFVSADATLPAANARHEKTLD
jgi:hypothetical protein